MDQKAQNPLFKHFRQPAIYIKFPGNGQHWKPGSLEIPESGEIPVYPLTTRDEITLRTPDALMNGTSVVEVLQSCIPNIKDAWATPSIDLDAALIAIRVASYGAMLEVNVTCPSCKAANDYEIDLRNSLANIKAPNFNNVVLIDGLRFKLKPQVFSSINKVNSLRFEEDKLMDHLSKTEIPEEERMKYFKDQLQKISDLNLEVLVDSTEYIQTESNDVVSDPEFILEFYQNSDAKIIKEIQNELNKINVGSGAQPEHITCGDCGHKFESKIQYDYASFFDLGS